MSIEVPTEVLADPGAPIDSASAVFTGMGVTVIVDQGPFADRLEGSVGRPEFDDTPTSVAGHTGRYVSFRTPEEHTYTMATLLSEPARITVVVRADDSVPARVARDILESLQLID